MIDADSAANLLNVYLGGWQSGRRLSGIQAAIENTAESLAHDIDSQWDWVRYATCAYAWGFADGYVAGLEAP